MRSSAHKRPLVLFAMEYVPRYRAPFYPLLKQRLDEDGIDLAISYGNPPKSRVGRQDAGTVSFGTFRQNREFEFLGRELTAQPIPKELRSADLTIVQQEAGLTLNYLLAARSLVGRKFAVWGHGEDPNDATRTPAVESMKAVLTRRSSWAFAYTNKSKSVFEELGMPSDRITVVNNALPPESVDDKAVDPEVEALAADLSRRRSQVGWIASSLDEGKRLDFLFSVLDGVRSRVPNFEFVVLGDGPGKAAAAEFALTRDWIHVLGARHGASKSRVGNVASVMVMPGAVGLHVLDSFRYGTPLIASDEPSNSHELDYVEHNRNGVMLRPNASVDEYVSSITALLDDPQLLRTLVEGAEECRAIYTMPNMVERFALGVSDALRRPA